MQPCPRCGEERLLYEITLVKQLPTTEMSRSWLRCQSCIADIIDFIDTKVKR